MSSQIWRRLLGVGVVALGLWLTVVGSVRLIHRAEGYRPGDADCDDCGLTLVLDNLGWLVAAVGGYVVLVALLWWIPRRSGSRRSGVGGL